MIDNQDIKNAIIEGLKKFLAVDHILLSSAEYGHDSSYYKLDQSFSFRIYCDNGKITIADDHTSVVKYNPFPMVFSVSIGDPKAFELLVDHLKARYFGYLVGPMKGNKETVRKSLRLPNNAEPC